VFSGLIQNRVDKLKALTGVLTRQGRVRVDLMMSYLNTADQVERILLALERPPQVDPAP
jgi:hypothetical protein